MFRQSLSVLAVMTVGLSPIVSANIASANDTEITNDYWWPNRLDLSPLRKNDTASNPQAASFDYAEAFKAVDVEELKQDLKALMTTSQDWWPADYGHYGPFFIRMSWHSAGTYRTVDGRGGADGGMQRFAPLNSWPDNGNLDKAQRLLWPIKQKYGNAVSWSDLIVLAGTIAMEDMGFKIAGFAFGREDAWEPEEVNWGPEGEWLGRSGRHNADGKLKKPFGAARMGLIYVNPEGPNGNPDPLLAAQEIRDTFGRMAMNDEETVALIAGGHTFGKAHGAARPDGNVGREPEAASIEEQGLGWKNKYGSGKGADTITSGLEGAWTVSPAEWTHNFFENLFSFEWEQTRSPAGAIQWVPTEDYASELVPDAHDPDKRHAPIMLTTDLALKFDPSYGEISKRFYEDPTEFEDAFARAWFKLTHRDMGPKSRYLGSIAPEQTFIWQDPVPAADYDTVSSRDIRKLKDAIRNSGLSNSDLVGAAWASASSYRSTDLRGGSNGARVSLAPQKDWAANDPAELAGVISKLEEIRGDFNKGRRKISLADLIVLAGGTAIEEAAKQAGHDIEVPFNPGRTDATQDMTDVASFDVLRPTADGFRNFYDAETISSPAQALIEKATFLNLTVPEMTVLVGGMRALDANTAGAKHGVFTSRPGTLSNDYFVNLVDMSTEWKKSESDARIYEGYVRGTDELKWTATPVDLIFGSNTELRAVAEFYAFENAEAAFVEDFVEAWTKVMNLGRF
ncbi:MAG: catalase/peroxidase HPI [Kordiimonadaceae bacterium]|nr:catalase/peroxidase HPI [Kordiimonadaceae bacterium]MBO6570440.1 catalase/peroxidase HPI [Kordiimonadaceae bacterium]MBO6966441.1 catalase/peroxidase HPI [Kordiimonadaceae bacterium]